MHDGADPTARAVRANVVATIFIIFFLPLGAMFFDALPLPRWGLLLIGGCWGAAVGLTAAYGKKKYLSQ